MKLKEVSIDNHLIKLNQKNNIHIFQGDEIFKGKIWESLRERLHSFNETNFFISAITRIKNSNLREQVKYSKKVTGLLRSNLEGEIKFRFDYRDYVIITVGKEEILYDYLPSEIKFILFISSYFICEDINNVFLFKPENYLSLYCQRRILRSIQKLLPKLKVFIVTNSPFIYGSVNSSVYTLKDNEIIYSSGSKGSSYLDIFEKEYGIKSLFDIDTEESISLLRKYKLKIIEKEKNFYSNIDKFKKLAKKLSKINLELNDIVGREYRQVSDIINNPSKYEEENQKKYLT